MNHISCSPAASALLIYAQVASIVARDFLASGSIQVRLLHGNLNVDQYFEQSHGGDTVAFGLPLSFGSGTLKLCLSTRTLIRRDSWLVKRALTHMTTQCIQPFPSVIQVPSVIH